MSKRKVEAIKGFVLGLAELKKEIKADSLKMIENLPLAVLADRDAFIAYLVELSEAITEKYLVNKNGLVPPRSAALIKRYVVEMRK